MSAIGTIAGLLLAFTALTILYLYTKHLLRKRKQQYNLDPTHSNLHPNVNTTNVVGFGKTIAKQIFRSQSREPRGPEAQMDQMNQQGAAVLRHQDGPQQGEHQGMQIRRERVERGDGQAGNTWYVGRLERCEWPAVKAPERVYGGGGIGMGRVMDHRDW